MLAGFEEKMASVKNKLRDRPESEKVKVKAQVYSLDQVETFSMCLKDQRNVLLYVKVMSIN